MKKQLNEIRKNENGSALVLAMMVFMVLAVLGATVGAVTVGSYKLGDANQETNSAYYIAEAGANMAYEEIENYVLDAYEESDSKVSFFEKMENPLGEENNQTTQLYDKFDTQSGDTPTAEIAIIPRKQDGNTKEYVIESVGEVAGKTRTVEKSFQVIWHNQDPGDSFPIDLSSVITFNEKATFHNNAFVRGDILYSTNGELNTGNNFEHEGREIKILSSEFNWLEKSKSVTDWVNLIIQNIINKISFQGKTSSDLHYNNNYFSNEDIVTNGGDIHFSNNTEVNGDIITNGGDIHFSNNTEINGNIITNGGDIHIHNGANITGNIISNGGEVHISNGLKLNGSIILTGNNKSVYFHNGAEITGNIILNGGNISISNNFDITGALINPKGKIEVHNGGEIEGVIIANSISISNNAEIEKSEDYLNYFPFKHNQNSEDNVETSLDDLISSTPALEQ